MCHKIFLVSVTNLNISNLIFHFTYARELKDNRLNFIIRIDSVLTVRFKTSLAQLQNVRHFMSFATRNKFSVSGDKNLQHPKTNTKESFVKNGFNMHRIKRFYSPTNEHVEFIKTN